MLPRRPQQFPESQTQAVLDGKRSGLIPAQNGHRSRIGIGNGYIGATVLVEVPVKNDFSLSGIA